MAIPNSCILDMVLSDCQEIKPQGRNASIKYNFNYTNIDRITINFPDSDTTEIQFSLSICSSTNLDPQIAHDMDVNVMYTNVSWVQININFTVSNVQLEVNFYRNCGEFAIIFFP